MARQGMSVTAMPLPRFEIIPATRTLIKLLSQLTSEPLCDLCAILRHKSHQNGHGIAIGAPFLFLSENAEAALERDGLDSKLLKSNHRLNPRMKTPEPSSQKTLPSRSRAKSS